MAKPIHFVAKLEAGDGGGAYVIFPYSTEEKFGIKGRVPVNATIDGEPYLGSLVKYGFAVLHVAHPVRDVLYGRK